MPQLIQFRPNPTSPPKRTLPPVLLIARSFNMHALMERAAGVSTAFGEQCV